MVCEGNECDGVSQSLLLVQETVRCPRKNKHAAPLNKLAASRLNVAQSVRPSATPSTQVTDIQTVGLPSAAAPEDGALADGALADSATAEPCADDPAAELCDAGAVLAGAAPVPVAADD